MKILITVIVTLVVAGGLTGAFFSRSRGMNEQATAVRLEPVQQGDLTELVNAPGLIQAKTKVSISARVAARIVELPFKEGDHVKKDESILVKLDAKDLEAQLRAVEARSAAQAAQIEMARAQLEASRREIVALQVELDDANRDLNRQKELLASSDVSQSIVDQAQAKYDRFKAQMDARIHGVVASEKNLLVMEHQLEAAQAEILRAKDNLSYTTIISPIDGTVTRVNAEVGELVVTGTMNNPGTVIMEVADLSQMLVRARVDEISIAAVEVGQRATVYVQAYEDQAFEGVVQTVALASTEEKDGSKNYKAEILLDSDGRRVLSGLTAEVDIETRRHSGILKVPSQSVLGRRVDDLPVAIRDAPEVDKDKTICPVVFRFIDGKAVITPVVVGPSDITHTVILGGLNENEQIITGPYKVFDQLAHDQKVKDEREGTASPDPSLAKTNSPTAAAR